jgi:hypothetical protein
LEEGIGKKDPLMVVTVTMKCIKHVNRLFNQGIDQASHAYSFQDLFVYETMMNFKGQFAYCGSSSVVYKIMRHSKKGNIMKKDQVNRKRNQTR